MSAPWQVDKSGFIQVSVTPDLTAVAFKRSEDSYAVHGNAGTHRVNQRRRFTGFLAEAAIKEVFPLLEFSSRDAVDFVCGGQTFDAKSQGCNATPLPFHAATLYEEQASKPVGYYVFARTANDSKMVWIAGYATRRQYLEQAKLLPAGTKTNNFTYEQARYEAEHRQLISPVHLFDELDRLSQIRCGGEKHVPG